VLFFLILKKSNEYRKVVLLIASYYFYGYWDWRFLSLILLSTAIDFITGKKIHLSNDEKTRKMWLMISMTMNLGLLGFFQIF
jgi:alginate O-acetyltransferase complex protein AlgI